MGEEESESPCLPNLSVDDRQLSAFSGLVQIEEGAEGEALVLDFEKVGVAPPAAHRVQSGRWSGSFESPYLRGERSR